MQIQINLPEELNKKLKLYRIEKEFKNMELALIEILDKFFKDKHG